MNILFEPYLLNKTLTLKNRIVMAPMTRNKADDQFVPTEAMAEYYARRADAGLIVTEGTIIRYDGRGYSNVPGIYTRQQINGWRKVSDAVHAKDGLIFMQIWHVGRVTHPEWIGGKLPISASATKMTGFLKRAAQLEYVSARAATRTDIQRLIESYALAAQNAIQAGFDGIEIHGANGYLIDQFLHYGTNLRQDEFGGTPENLARFALEVVKACGQTIGFDRVGIRLSPGGYLHEIISDKRDEFVFSYLLQELQKLNIAYVHTGNFDDSVMYEELQNLNMTGFMRRYYPGNLIACGGYTLASATTGIESNAFDLMAFGKSFIANPNLIHLSKTNRPLKPYDVGLLEHLL